MENNLLILGVVCIISGILMTNRRFNEKIIRIENRVRGLKSEITETTLKFQQLVGGFILIVGIIILLSRYIK